MAKSKQHRALFEVLLKSHAQEPPKVTVQAKPGAAAPAAAGVAAKPATEAPKPAGPAVEMKRPAAPAARVAKSAEAIFAQGRFMMTYYQLAICLLAGLVLCCVSFVAGMHFGGGSEPPLPRTAPRPTMKEVAEKGVTPGLVRPGPADTAVGGAEHPGDGRLVPLPPGKSQPIPIGGAEKAVSPEKAAGGAEETGDPNGKLRLRIAQLKNTDSAKTDRLRAFLSQGGLETELVARGGNQFLYGRAKFVSDTGPKAKAYKEDVVRLLKDFKKQTGITVSTDAFYVAAD